VLLADGAAAVEKRTAVLDMSAMIHVCVYECEWPVNGQCGVDSGWSVRLIVEVYCRRWL